MTARQAQRDGRAERVPDDDRLLHAQGVEQRRDAVGLGSQ